jgi:pycsar effector protein
MMNAEKATQASREQLNLILSFFVRVEAKSSVLLAIDTSMLGFLAAKAPRWQDVSAWMAVAAVLTLLLLGASIVTLYRGAFPQLSGGHGSLIYFREIANRTEHRFVEEFKTQSDEHYANDLLGQVWRNSEILRAKFDCLKYAFTFMALGILPWLVTVILFATRLSAHNN